METYFAWQKEQTGCKCPYHRYHVAHLCECGKLYSHSQADCDEHRGHAYLAVDPTLVRHGDKWIDVFDTYVALGLHSKWLDRADWSTFYDIAASQQQ